MPDHILEMKEITKDFPGVKALDNVTFQVKKGEIHALVGENGAGKSTLMKVLSGVYPSGSYEGDIIYNNQVMKFHNIKESEKSGIAIIYQELALVKSMTISENIFLGDEIATAGVIDWNQTISSTAKVLNEVGLDINPNTKVIDLGVGEQQLVEIAKALSKNADVLILDEPTAALTEAESKRLFSILRELKKKGVTCIFISHRLKEVFELADTITILRDGKTITTQPSQNLDEDKLIALMVGRELTQRYPRKLHKAGEVVLEIKNWTVNDPELNEVKVENVSLKVREGEILGIAGLVGAGRTELMMSIFGAWGNVKSGELILEGKKLNIKNTVDAINSGISLLSEDRKRYGLVLELDVKQNITLAGLCKIAKFDIINKNEEIKVCQQYINDLKIKTPNQEQKVKNLSGGNQQKVVIGKWLMTAPKVLILDEPTRGIDVGAKYEIYSVMNALIDQGVCIVMISSDLPEILGMSDRIVVMHEGKITGEMLIEEASQEKIMSHATGRHTLKEIKQIVKLEEGDVNG